MVAFTEAFRARLDPQPLLTAVSHRNCRLYSVVSDIRCRGGGDCHSFNFYFFAFDWDPCPSGGTKGYQGV